MVDAEDTGARLERLRTQLSAARRADRGAPGERTRHVDAASALILALVEELEEDEADQVFAELIPLIASNPSLDVATRRRLAYGFDEIREHERAIEQLRAAHARARESGLVDIAAELARELGDTRTHVPRPITHTGLAEAAAHETDPERAAGLQLSLSRAATGDAAILHARKSLEHAYETVDPEVVATSITHLAELLAERGDLAEAKNVLGERPPTRDSRAARALYDHIRRKLGEPVGDPPDEPDEPAELPAPVRAYFTKPTNLARSIIEGALPGESQLRAWSAGTVARPADLASQTIFGPVRSFWCECGMYRGREYSGLYCQRCGVELIHASARRTRVGLLALAAPVVHPWYVAAAGILLELSPVEVAAMPVPDVRSKLAGVELAAVGARLKQAIITAPKAKLADEAGKKLAVIDAFTHAGKLFDTTPSSLVIDLVLVAPPEAQLGFDRAAVQVAYTRVLGDASAVPALFDALARR